MSLSYHPLHLVDVSVCTIAVHRGFALLVRYVLLQHGSKLVGCPVAAEPVPSLRRLNQPIDPLLALIKHRFHAPTCRLNV
jgi:hypothetical protein